MNVLRAIGAFFVKIWHWIKDTAWVQPLLIVGIIFAIIFSIPAIVNGITTLNQDLSSSEAYYGKFQLSLENGTSSAADNATSNILEKTDDSSIASTNGEKFFVAYVSESCSSCAEAKGGFNTLESNFNDKLKPNDGLPFKMITVFTDEVTEDTTSKETAFVQYMNRNQYFFEYAASVGYNTDYYLNGKISDADLEAVESCDPDDFLTPTIILVDYTDNSPIYGVSEILFGVTGDNDWQKAQLLLDCWNHTEDFAAK